MNYLAHAYFSNNNSDLLVGNFIADHLRGNDFNRFSPAIIDGIFLHRRIDTFTDAHPEFKKAKRLFYNGFEKYSGVLVDIYFDHLLAKNFADFHTQNLDDFSADVYKIYTSHQHILPESSNRFLEYVLKNNIYSAYSSIKGIERVLHHLSHRIKHQVKLDDSVTLFVNQESQVNEYFTRFISDAKREFLS